MAKKNDKEESINKFEQSCQNILKKKFEPIYILCGEEPYYSDVIIKLLIDNVLKEEEKDFNLTVIYGSDTDMGQVVSLCRRYPMWSEKQLVIVKEAQHLNLSPLEYYLKSPAPDTILALAFTNKSLDKRTTLYKTLKEQALILESFNLDEWKIPGWIKNYLGERGYSIEDSAAELLAQSTGVGLRKLALEIEKLIVGVDTKNITVRDVEVNIGVSRDYNPFELCKSISYKQRGKAFEIAKVFGTNPKKYPLVLTIGAMFYYFNQLLKIEALVNCNNVPFEVASRQSGVYLTSKIKEYEIAMRNYPLKKTMAIISYIKQCDYKSKSNERGTADDGALLNELLTMILI